MQNEIVTNIKQFILGGKAEFTIYQEATNGKSSREAHYKVTKNESGTVWFVHINSKYQGYLTKWDICTLRRGKGKENNYDEAGVKALLWVLSHASSPLPKEVHILHHGRCSVCGRKLTDSKSIQLGIGPTCRERIGLRV